MFYKLCFISLILLFFYFLFIVNLQMEFDLLFDKTK